MDVEAYLAPRPAPRWLFERANRHPGRPRFFVRHGDKWSPITWGEHAATVHAAAAALLGMAGERGAVFAANSTEWAAAALGLEAAGVTVVPIYPASTADQAAYIVEHSHARVVFLTSAEVARVRERRDAYVAVRTFVLLDDSAPPDARFVRWSDFLGDAGAPGVDQAVERIDMESTAIMLYTSGTTGRPKGVPLSHLNIGINTADWLRCNAKALHDDAVDLLWLPLSHIFGFGEVCLGNMLGFTSYLATPKTVIDLMPEVRPTVFMSVPAYWEKLAAPAMAATSEVEARAAFDRTTGGRLRYCLSGGAGLKREVKETFRRCGTLIIEGYGLTETSPTLTINRPDDYRFDSVGKPVPSIELRLGDDGEILARGPSVFSGYHNDPEATKAAFTDDGWFCTGDIGRWTEDGFLQIIDRKKEILVTAGGKNVPPANVERELTGQPVIANAVVYGDGKKYLVAGIWLDHAALAAELGHHATPAEQQQAAAAAVEQANVALARCEQIKKFALIEQPLTVEDGLLTATLKLKRKPIYARYGHVFEALYG